MELKAGGVLTLTTDEAHRNEGDQDCIFVDYPNITKVHMLCLWYYVLTLKKVDIVYLWC